MHAYPRRERTQNCIFGAVTGSAFWLTPGKATGHCPSGFCLVGPLCMDLPCGLVLSWVGRKPEITQELLSVLLDAHL